MNPNLVGAGLYDAQIKLASGAVFDVYAVRSVSASPDNTITEIEGDDIKIATFNFNMAEEISLEMNGISFAALQAITGNTVSNSSASTLELPLGTSNETNPPVFELSGYTRMKMADNTAGTFIKVFHQCQIQGTPEITQEYQGALTVNATVKAFVVSKDITGATLNPARISTIKVTKP